MSKTVTQRNILAIKDFTETTREMMRKMEEEMKTLQNNITTQQVLITQQQKQIAVLQAKLLNGNATE